MDKATPPQQLSFVFDAFDRQSNVSLGTVPSADSAGRNSAEPVAVVYDFRAAVIKRKESAHASLYRQILDSVRHIG